MSNFRNIRWDFSHVNFEYEIEYVLFIAWIRNELNVDLLHELIF